MKMKLSAIRAQMAKVYIILCYEVYCEVLILHVKWFISYDKLKIHIKMLE